MAGFIDRITYISPSNFEYIKELENQKVLGIDSSLQRKDIFFLAMALGLESPKDLPKQHDFIRNSYFKEEGEALLRAVNIGTAESENEIDEKTNLNNGIKYCEKCAEGGFAKLRELVAESTYSGDFSEDVLEKKLLVQLKFKFKQYFKDNL
jgi:hypothetical protein